MNKRGNRASPGSPSWACPTRIHRYPSMRGSASCRQRFWCRGRSVTEWPGVWFSDPLVGTNRVVLLRHTTTRGRPIGEHSGTMPRLSPRCIRCPERHHPFWRTMVFCRRHQRRCPGEMWLLLRRIHRGASPGRGSAADLFIDHGSEKGVEDSFRYNQVTWPTPPNRGLKAGGTAGDWLYLDVYFDRPFQTPPVVLLTARDNDGDVKKHFNPLIPIAQNVSTHGFTAALRNTDTIDAMGEFYWVAIGCNAGCG